MDPPGSIRANLEENVPIFTVCLREPGIPFSSLQLFNLTDATNETFFGTDPRGPQDDHSMSSKQ